MEVTSVGKFVAAEVMTSRRRLAAPTKPAQAARSRTELANKPGGITYAESDGAPMDKVGRAMVAPPGSRDEQARNNGFRLSLARRSCINDIAEGY